MRYGWLGLFCGLWSSLLLAAQSEPSWQLVVDSYPPYIDELSPGQGVLTQWVQQIMELQKLPYQIKYQPWQKVSITVTAPQHASFLWFKTPDLEQNWLFSAPLTRMQTVLLKRADLAYSPERLDQLRPYKIGVTQGYFYGEEFKQLRPQLRLTSSVSDYESLQLLLNGKLDYVLMDPIVAHQLLKASPAAIQQKVRYLAHPLLTSQPVYLVCSRNYLPCNGFIQKFDQGLAILQQQGKQLALFGPGVQLLP